MTITWQVFELAHFQHSSGSMRVEIVQDDEHRFGPLEAVAAAFALSPEEFERTTIVYARFVAIRPARAAETDRRPVAFYVRRLG